MSKVTVLMPVYNGGHLLRRALQSVANQTMPPARVVVGNDGSTDETLDILASSQLPELRVIQNPGNIGWAPTVNLLVGELETEYVAVLHADDWWEPRFLEVTAAMLDAAPAAQLAVCAARVLHPNRPDTVWGLHQAPSARAARRASREAPFSMGTREAVAALCEKNWIRCPAVLSRSELYRRYGYEESQPFSCDWLMWLRGAALGPVGVTPEVLANFQVHEKSQTSGFMRANVTGIDMLRMVQVLRAEWRGDGEPFPGALERLRSGITNEILIDAGLKVEGGDLAGAEAQLRLARAIAPSLRHAALGLAGQAAITVLRQPLGSGLRTTITQLGRRAW